ncbi:MAG: AsmA-like C-terminal domain-containing protein [Desulfuromonadaceae bacterium]
MRISLRVIRLSGIFLVAFATLVIATALFLPYLLDVNAYRNEISSALQQSLNRPVSFSSGTFTWHFGPSFKFKSFTVKEIDGKADFITARQITVTVALLPLLERNIEFRNLILDGAAISLFRRADGTFNIDDLLKPGADRVKLDFKKISITKGELLWSDLSGLKEPFSEAVRNISFSADSIGRGQKGHMKLSADIPGAKGAPTRISVSGNLQLPPAGISLRETVLDGDLSLKHADIGKYWGYFGRYIPFANSGGQLDVVTGFKGRAQDFRAKGKITISGASVNWPTVFHSVLAPKALQLEYSAAVTKELISLSAVDLSMEGFRIKGSFQMQDYLSKDPRITARGSTPATFRYEDVRPFVPYGIIERDTADYIENRIKTGIFKLDTGVLDGRISQITRMEIGNNGNTLLIRGPVEKATLSYGPKAPTFNNIKGIIELKGKNFNLIGMTGNFGTAPFSLDGSITEYNTDKPSDYPVKMSIAPHTPEMAWLAKFAAIPMLEYSNSSALLLSGSGHYSAYRLQGDWDLTRAAYSLPGYVNKPQALPNSLKFSSVIGKNSTTVTSVSYTLQPMSISGSGLIGYGTVPYLGFDLQTNSFVLNDALPILSLWRKYKPEGTVQAHIKGGGSPDDLSAMDYNGSVDLTRFSLLPDEKMKQLSGINGTINFKGNSLETSGMVTRYGSSTITMKAAIRSLKNPEGDLQLSSPQLFLRDVNLAEGHPEASIRRFNAHCTAGKDAIVLHSSSGLINSSNFNMSGVFTTGRNPRATVSVVSSQLDLNDLRIFSTPPRSGDKPEAPGMDVTLTLNAESGNFGRAEFSKLNATVHQEKGILYLREMNAALLGGQLTAKGRIAPGGEQGDRYDLHFDIARADAEKLLAALDISREATGTLSLQGDLTARGNTLLEVKKSALGNVRLQMVNGTLRKFNTLAKVFSILNVSQLLKFKLPDLSSYGIPYSSIKGSFSMKDGILTTQDLFITSSSINVSIVGSADIVREELNVTLGAQPLQTVDKIINRIPIVGWLLTGKDKDLLTAYFEAKGKWTDPHVTAIPVKSMGRGMLNIFIRAFQLPVKLFTDTGEVILGQ